MSCLKKRIDRTGILIRLESFTYIVMLVVHLGRCTSSLVQGDTFLPDLPAKKEEGNKVFGKKKLLVWKCIIVT